MDGCGEAGSSSELAMAARATAAAVAAAAAASTRATSAAFVKRSHARAACAAWCDAVAARLAASETSCIAASSFSAKCSDRGARVVRSLPPGQLGVDSASGSGRRGVDSGVEGALTEKLGLVDTPTEYTALWEAALEPPSCRILSLDSSASARGRAGWSAAETARRNGGGGRVTGDSGADRIG